MGNTTLVQQLHATLVAAQNCGYDDLVASLMKDIHEIGPVHLRKDFYAFCFEGKHVSDASLVTIRLNRGNIEKKIPAIKVVRDCAEMSLIEAKNVVEALAYGDKIIYVTAAKKQSAIEMLQSVGITSHSYE